MKRFFALLLLASVSAASAYGFNEDTDICGDPEVTDDMIKNPMKVIDHLRNLDTNKRAVDRILNNNDFLNDLEGGKLSKDRARDFVIQMAYVLERDARSMAAGYNNFGFVYPVQENRDFFQFAVMKLGDGLEKLQRLGAKFDVNAVEDLVRHDPNPLAMMWSTALSEAIMHTQHHAEIVANMAIMCENLDEIMQRIKRQLQSNAAYKAWGLNDDDLAFFDVWSPNNADRDDLERIVRENVRQGLRQDVTICQLRRRLNNFNVARVLFWDALSDEHKTPSSVAGGRF